MRLMLDIFSINIKHTIEGVRFHVADRDLKKFYLKTSQFIAVFESNIRATLAFFFKAPTTSTNMGLH